MAKQVKQDTEDSLKLQPNKLYTGVVNNVDDVNRQLLVRIDNTKHLIRCTYAGGIFSSMFGLQTRFLPQKNTKVALLYGASVSYIIACLPSIGGDSVSGATEVITGTLPKNTPFYKKGIKDNGAFIQPHAMDLLEGELDLTNAFSVGIRLLTAVASLDAGGRAKVEALLLDDMVRIVSENFAQYSAFGNYEIYNDGRLNVCFDGTSYPHESYGVRMEEERIKMNGYEADLEKITAETGRWRFSEYIGFLGDFITKIITEPTAAIGAFSESNLRAGKSRVHYNSDGSILMQSVADIVLERVCRIPVPVEIKSPNTASINHEDLEKKYLKIWEYGESVDDMAQVSFQLREYARWLSNYHAYARFHQLPEEWSVPIEEDTPVPKQHCQEKDKAKVVGNNTIDVYSTIRIMRDGSIVILNGCGSSVVMAGYDTYVSSARDLVLEAAGDIIMTAGSSIHIKAAENITISATLGQFITKARTMWKALCERGTVWIKSDKTDKDSEDGLEMTGVLIDAPVSEIRAETTHSFNVLANGTGSESSINLITNGTTAIQGYGTIDISTPTNLILRGTSSVVIPTKLLESEAHTVNFGGAFSINGGRVAATVFSAETLQAQFSIQGPEMPGSSDGHLNHIAVWASAIFKAAKLSIKCPANYLKASTNMPSRAWAFTDDSYVSASGKCETYAQQYANMQYNYLYESVSVESEGLLTGRYTQDQSTPWPGRGARVLIHSGGEDLTRPAKKGYDNVTVRATKFENAPYAFRRWSP